MALIDNDDGRAQDRRPQREALARRRDGAALDGGSNA
jgi:hypothetical protein